MTETALPSRPAPGRLASMPGWAFAALVFAVALLCYGSALNAGWIWDDDAYVTHNRVLVEPGGLLRMWTVPTSIPQWYPLVHTTFWLELRLFGPHPFAFHLINVLLHAGSALLLARVITRLELPGARWSALLFTVHPVMVESVAWVTERKNCLSLILALGAFLCWMRFQGLHGGPAPERRPWRWWWTGLFLFLGALLSKSVVASLPAAALVVLWAKRGRFGLRDVVPLLPWFALGIGLGLHTAALEKLHVGAQGPDWDFSFAQRVLIAGRALCHYFVTLAWPVDLSFMYPKWSLDPSDPRGWLFVAVVVAVPAYLWIRRGTWSRWPLAAFLLWAGILFPALGFLNVFPFIYSFVADHFQYHATLGFIALAGAGMERLRRAGSAAGAVLTVCLAALGTLTFVQGWMYADSVTLWRTTLRRNPDAAIAWNFLGQQFISMGRLEEAEGAYRKALELEPRSYIAWINLGNIRLLKGEHEEALGYYEESLRVLPEFVAARVQRAIVLSELDRAGEGIAELRAVLQRFPEASQARGNLGNLLRLRGDLEEAEGVLREGLALDPWEPQLLVTLGQVLIDAGRHGEAVETLTRALGVDPRNAIAWRAAGRALHELRDGREVQAFEKAAELESPPDPETFLNLGNALLRNGRLAEAEGALKRSLLLRPDNVDAWRSLAAVLETGGREDDAALAHGRALSLDPEDPVTLSNIGAQHARLGRWGKAVEVLGQVLRIDPESEAALSVLAWIRAACPDPTLRDPGEGVALAERLVALETPAPATREDTLAIALAAAGRMDDAIAVLERAAALPDAAAGTPVGDQIRVRLEAFRRGERLLE